MIFHSFGSLSVTSAGGVSFAAASATLPYVVVRPEGLCVMTLLAALHSAAGTLQAGERALPHLGARDPHHDRVVRADDHPRVDLGRAVLRAHDAGAERDLQAEGEPGADSRGADHERAPIDLRGPGDHGSPLCL